MGANFNLKTKTKLKSSIRLIYRQHGKTMVYGTGISIPVKYWDTRKQRAKYNPSFKQATHINIKLKNIEDALLSITNEIERSGQAINMATLKEKLTERLNPKNTKSAKYKPLTFLESMEQTINTREASPKFAPGTIKKYRQTLNNLKAYHKKHPFDFETMDIAFFENLTAFFMRKGLSTNYVAKIIKTTKVFINDAAEKRITVNPDYKSKKTNIKEEEVYNIYLSVEELKHLYNLDLSNDERLDKIRDRFLVGAFTGLRYSDYSLLIKENFRIIDNQQFIFDESQKTGTSAMIPVHPIVLAIMEKYNWVLPKARGERNRPISQQKFNEYLKELAQIAGYNEELVFYESKGGKRQRVIIPKWKLVTSHTARRSFITNCLIAGIPETVVMKLTGIKKRETLNKYIKLTPLDSGALAAKNGFFK